MKGNNMSNTTQTKAVEITESNFDELVNASTPTLVDFWAPWCGPCKALGPTIDELAQDFQGKSTVGKVNVDDNPALAQKFGVSSIPTVLVFQNGQVVETLIGLRPKEAYAEALSND
tara:strand:+ start:101 stop:448 length:348 start_codon:yes stop_codon:yes gene_type:complete